MDALSKRYLNSRFSGKTHLISFKDAAILKKYINKFFFCSVVSDFQHRRNRSSSGNLAARLGILPENRTILDFKEPGNVFSTTNGLQIKTYGLIDDVIKPEEKSGGGNNSIIRNPNSVESGSGSGSIRKSSNTGQESGYGSDGATTNSSRASP